MKRRLLLFVVCVTVVGAGCYDQRITALEQRVTTLETEHTKTRKKLDSLLIWANRQSAPNVGLMNWIDSVHAKLWPGGPSDPVKPANPPEPF